MVAFAITVSVGPALASLGADVDEIPPLRIGVVLAVAQFGKGGEDHD